MNRKLEDASLVDLVTNVDDRGWLIEILRSTDHHFKKFGQLYVVGDMAPKTIRAYHKHEELWDWFFIANGSAKFVLGETDEDYPNKISRHEVFNIHARVPKLLIVPPTLWHGWMSLEENTILISTASEVYNKEKPDEVRISWDTIGKEVWEIQYK